MYEKLKSKRHLPPRRREDSSIFRYIPHSLIKIRIFEGESDGWNLPVEQGSNTFTSHCAPNRPVTQCKRLSSKNNRHSRSAYSKKKSVLCDTRTRFNWVWNGRCTYETRHGIVTRDGPICDTDSPSDRPSQLKS